MPSSDGASSLLSAAVPPTGSWQSAPFPDIIGYVISAHPDQLARDAYEGYRGAYPTPLPPWEDIDEQEQAAWKAAVSVIAGQRKATRAEAAPPPSLLIRAADFSRSFSAEFTAGPEGNLVIDDDFASGQHARFRVARSRWYIEDLGSTNGTWLNGRRIQAAQWLRKGDKIRIGRTVMSVESA